MTPIKNTREVLSDERRTVSKCGNKFTSYTKNNSYSDICDDDYTTKAGRKYLNGIKSIQQCVVSKVSDVATDFITPIRPRSAHYAERRALTMYIAPLAAKIIDTIDMHKTIAKIAKQRGDKPQNIPSESAVFAVLICFVSKVHKDTVTDRLDYAKVSREYAKTIRGDSTTIKYAMDLAVALGILVVSKSTYTFSENSSEVRAYRYSDAVIDHYNSDDNKITKGLRARVPVKVYTKTDPAKNEDGEWVADNTKNNSAEGLIDSAAGTKDNSKSSIRSVMHRQSDQITVKSGNGEEYVMDDSYIDVDYLIRRAVYGLRPPKTGLTRRFSS